jgi:predicted permease
MTTTSQFQANIHHINHILAPMSALMFDLIAKIFITFGSVAIFALLLILFRAISEVNKPTEITGDVDTER